MTGQITAPIAQVTTPSLELPNTQGQKTRGICTLTFPGAAQPLQFRTNPNEITWDYELITKVQQTYGGRVVQVLGVKMDNLVVKVDCGAGGWPYAMYVAQFMRDMMVTQRNGQAGTFTYTTRNWKLKVFAKSIPFFDTVTETIRELELTFAIQEDIAGTNISSSIADALTKLQVGVGWLVSGFNNLDYAQGSGSAPNNDSGGGVSLGGTPSSLLATPVTSSISGGGMGLPAGLSGILGGFGGF